ncbi:DNA helicase [Clostridium sp. FP2]|uniref:DnaB-like helicase C-terminal domain-containing protein n=1 Tax=Clostridium sp. FP2 TaxID=2724481 RepID=UPI0013E909FA|nr:DnaB-like helicase C-terminal domain-containing protein [Clostridium sp. FP2]MBZ9622952.1 DNA helicase [Clostridium sp. FP2]
MSEDINIQDISTESLAIGMILNDPNILLGYLDLINPVHDFSDENLRFLYNQVIGTYLNHDVISETSVNIEISKLEDDQQTLYKKLGGYKSLQRLAQVATINQDFKKIYGKLKTFNVLRELQLKGFKMTEEIYEKLKDKSVEFILRAYELQLTKVGTHIGGVNDSVRLGDGIVDFYEKLKLEPDIGIEIPFSGLNYLTRGIRKRTVNSYLMLSGQGKSRLMVRILVHTSIIGNTKFLVLVNEENLSDWQLKILTCVANVVFSDKYGGLIVEENEIARGLTGMKDAMVKEAAEYIQLNSKIRFFETQIYDYETIRMTFRQHRLRYGIEHYIIDTMKAYRGKGTEGMAEYAMYAYTIERFKALAKELDISITLTQQLLDTVQETKKMDSTQISGSKSTKHSMDTMVMYRKLDYADKKKIKVKIQMDGNPFNGQVQDLEKDGVYYLCFLEKNRAGLDKVNLILKVNVGAILFQEIGTAVFSSGKKKVEEE